MNKDAKFSIRKMEIDDLSEVVFLEQESIVAAWNKEQLQFELLENPFALFKVAVAETGTIIGFIIYWITFDSATIAQIVVKDEYRRQGIATVLLKTMIQDCLDKHVRLITLEVRVSNEAAIKLYEENGFKKERTKENYYPDGEDAFYMMREVY